MTPLFVIARSTFREALRRRILNVLLVFALAMIIGSFAFSSFMSTTTEAKMVADMGLSAIELFGVVISIVMANVMIPMEIERRSIHTILSKPVSRRIYVLGKFLGGIYTIGFNTLIMGIVFLAALWAKAGKPQWYVFEAVFMWFCMFVLLMAIAVMLSVLVSPMLNAFICICVIILGNLSSYLIYLKTFARGSGAAVAFTKQLFMWIYNLVPNLQNYDVNQRVAAGGSVTAHFLVVMTLWTLLYVAFLLLMTVHFFSNKEV